MSNIPDIKEKNVLVYTEYRKGNVGQLIVRKEFDNFLSALEASEFLSEIANQKGWTRHSSCECVIRHGSMYSDLFNEGSIMLNVHIKEYKPDESENKDENEKE